MLRFIRWFIIAKAVVVVLSSQTLAQLELEKKCILPNLHRAKKA